MRNATPMSWIEQAEAREVLATALFESAAAPSWYSRAWHSTVGALASERIGGMLRMIAPREMVGGPLLQMQPALVRRGADRRDACGRQDEAYTSSW